MIRLWRGILVLGLSCYVLASSDFSHFKDEVVPISPTFFDDQLETMEPMIVPEPEDGSPWWYTPSRKAHIFKHRHAQSLKLNKQSGRQGEEMRLPGDIIPLDYTIESFPFVELIESGNYSTNGYVEILVQVVRATRNISLNSAELDIDLLSISVWDVQANSPLAINRFYDEQLTREIITIQTAVELVAGQQYKIAIRFKSTLNGDLRGFYRSSYVEDGVRKWLAVTQFESTDARRAFPCFDEPSMKATFTVSLGRKESMTSVSNMDQSKTDPMIGMPGYVWDRYKKSVKMSTYLVAFLVSDFINIAAPPGASNVQFRIWSRESARDLTSYSLDIGPKILEYYESYFGIDYPLPKQDMAAIPDFASGAMENWGLITYREVDLLIDTKTASARLKQRVGIVNAHELAHQWFGDLVTMEWWNAIWLNEGFASYMEFVGTDAVEPGFRMDDQFVVENLQYVFGIDGLETSRPINLEVNTPDEISALFDAISYEKGSCIIRMAADFLGIETFKRGLNRYLTQNAYGNAQQDDLWRALQEQADEDKVILPATVKEIMDTWTYKMGFPVVKVIRDYTTGGASVTQERFLLRKSESSPPDSTVYQWWVPLTYTSAQLESTERKSLWMSDEENHITVDNLETNADQWVVFNVDQQNYYRVAYDEANYELLAAQLSADHQRIKTNNRAQLLDDTFILASVNSVPYKAALDLSLYLKNEIEYVPWNAVLSEFNYIDNMLFKLSQYPDWKSYVITLVEPYYKYVGFQESETDEHLKLYSRTDAMSWACRLQIPDCVNNANAKYAELMADPDNSLILSANQRTVILRTGVENGKQAEWDFAFNQYKTKLDTAFLVAATCSKDSTRLYNLLEMMLDENSGIRLSDVNTLFNNVAANSLGNDIATNFLVNRWDDIANSRLGTKYFVNFFRYLCNRQNTQKQLDTLLKLRQDHFDILGNSNTVQQGIDIVKENIKWTDLHQEEIGAWLKGEPASTQPTESTTEQSTTVTTIETTSEGTTGTTTGTTTETTPETTSEATTETTTTSASSTTTTRSTTTTGSTSTKPTTTTSTTTTTPVPETTTQSAANRVNQLNVCLTFGLVMIGKLLLL